jgi:adenine-specific DNA-methyltransferase
MNPYWSGDGIDLWHGRCEDVLPTIDPDSVDALLTDPPYFQVKDEDWDNQWDKATEFLEWLGAVTDQLKPALRPHASVWMFASPQLVNSVESVLAKRFRILNSVRWVKENGIHKRSEIASLRRFLTPWEGVIFAEQFGCLYEDTSASLHRTVFAPIGDYIRSERERAGLTRRQISVQLTGYRNPDSANANIFNWELGKNLISQRDYESIRAALQGSIPSQWATQTPAVRLGISTSRRPRQRNDHGKGRSRTQR